MSFFDFLRILEQLLQALGMLIFGVGAAWFTLYAFRQPERRWQLQVAVFLGFFFFVALVAYFISPSGIGAFTLGAGVALLLWGLRLRPADEDKEQD